MRECDFAHNMYGICRALSDEFSIFSDNHRRSGNNESKTQVKPKGAIHMKILMLADSLDNGGAETHIYDLSVKLSQAGHNISVLSSGGNISECLKEQNICQIRYHSHPLRTVYQTIREQKPDVVHAHTRRAAFLCRILLTFMDFPFVFTAHARFSTEYPKNILSYFPKRTIAVSRDIAAHLTTRFGVSEASISIIENGINTKKFCPKRDRNSRHNIVMISRMDKDCSLAAHLLCRVTPALQKHFPKLSVTLVGGGNDYEGIKRHAERVNHLLRKQVIHAVGNKQNVLPYLHSADIFVGVSRAALEAMACECPVILCGNEGYLGILSDASVARAEETNYCGRGMPLPDAKKLYGDICKLFSDKQTASACSKLGRQQLMSCHTACRMAEKTLSVYKKAVHDVGNRRQSDILLCGYYGYGNLGDEMTLQSVRQGLTNEKRDVRLAVLTPRGKHYRNILCIDRFHPIKLFTAIRHTGLLVLGGGSLLQNKTSNRSLLYYLGLIYTAQLLGTPTILYAGGIGPVNGAIMSRLCFRVLARMDRLYVRDMHSYRLLEKAGLASKAVPVADPVLLCRTPREERTESIAVAVKAEAYRDILSYLIRQRRPVNILLFDSREDTLPSRKLAIALRQLGIPVYYNEAISPSEILSCIARADFVVSARLHACILARLCHVPFTIFSNDPKLLSFYSFSGNFVSNETLLNCHRKRTARLPKLAIEKACRKI